MVLVKLLLVISLLTKVFATNKIVCYYMSLNGYKHFPPEEINPNLCTHLNYAFVGLDSEGTLTPATPDLDLGSNLYKRVVNLKKSNPDLKILLSLGGVPLRIISEVAGNETKRLNLAKTSLKLLQTYNFDGLDVDWEFPTDNQKESFSLMLEQLRAYFGDKYLLTSALSAIPKPGYDVPRIIKVLDFINIMGYDFYGSWSSHTGQNSALFKSPVESVYEKKYLNIKATLKNYLAVGAPRDKIVMGVAFYGRQFTLANPSNHKLQAPILGGGKVNAASYSQICRLYGNWTRVWDDHQKNPYKYSGDQWIGYDDDQSIALKAKYIKEQRLEGIMIWHIGQDDIHGDCWKGETQKLLKTINKVVFPIKTELRKR